VLSQVSDAQCSLLLLLLALALLLPPLVICSFHDNKYVQEIGVRFYCGAPLVSSSGHRLGTLCFADSEPRVFDTSSLQILVNFAELVSWLSPCLISCDCTSCEE
jgi:GAF domain-containing protein